MENSEAEKLEAKIIVGLIAAHNGNMSHIMASVDMITAKMIKVLAKGVNTEEILNAHMKNVKTVLGAMKKIKID